MSSLSFKIQAISLRMLALLPAMLCPQILHADLQPVSVLTREPAPMVNDASPSAPVPAAAPTDSTPAPGNGLQLSFDARAYTSASTSGESASTPAATTPTSSQETNARVNDSGAATMQIAGLTAFVSGTSAVGASADAGAGNISTTAAADLIAGILEPTRQVKLDHDASMLMPKKFSIDVTTQQVLRAMGARFELADGYDLSTLGRAASTSDRAVFAQQNRAGFKEAHTLTISNANGGVMLDPLPHEDHIARSQLAPMLTEVFETP